MDHLKLTTDLLSVDTISDLVCDDSCGAVSIFVGTTRDNFEGKKVLRLEYEAYEPMAIKAMKNICDEVRNKWSSVHSIAMYHRLGQVPIREASVVIAVSSPHRQHSLSAVAHCIERLKSSVPIWKKEVYDAHAPVWKENVESQAKEPSPPPQETQREEIVIDPSMVQINVSNEELQKRIQNFIERKREQVNMSNIQDFIPSKSDKEEEEMETCARVRTQFVRRNDSKGHLKIRKVHNEWGPLCASARPLSGAHSPTSGLPPAIAERVLSMERFLHAGPVPRDIYRRLKGMEDRLKELEALSPEYAHFWKSNKDTPGSTVKQEQMDYTFSADDIAKKIEQFERQGEL